jgi:hypothetical protein
MMPPRNKRQFGTLRDRLSENNDVLLEPTVRLWWAVKAAK